jgi:hypothetical protein
MPTPRQIEAPQVHAPTPMRSVPKEPTRRSQRIQERKLDPKIGTVSKRILTFDDRLPCCTATSPHKSVQHTQAKPSLHEDTKHGLYPVKTTRSNPRDNAETRGHLLLQSVRS